MPTKIDIHEIFIPERDNAAHTYLRVRLVYKNKRALETLPYVLILPGGPGANHSHYLDYDRLYEVANLLYYDPRGCGLSDEGDLVTYNMENYIDDLYVIHKSLKLRSVILLGKSYGAMCALGYTLRYPQDVSKLILAAGTPVYEFIKTSKLNLRLRGTPEQKKMRALWTGDIKNDEHMSEYTRVMASLYSWKIRHHQVVERIAPMHRFCYEAVNEGFRNHFWKFDYTHQLCNIHCPTLILVCEEDWICDPKCSLV